MDRGSTTCSSVLAAIVFCMLRNMGAHLATLARHIETFCEILQYRMYIRLYNFRIPHHAWLKPTESTKVHSMP
eukprot:1363265-Amphidinium_carterae.1